jgi:hypothetical protein
MYFRRNLESSINNRFMNFYLMQVYYKLLFIASILKRVANYLCFLKIQMVVINYKLKLMSKNVYTKY